MNTKQVAINRGLVFDGLLFKTFNARGRYIGTDTAKRPQWLKDHPNDFVRLADILGDKIHVRTDVITQDVGSNLKAPYPGPLAADKADNNAQLARTPLQGRLPIDQEATNATIPTRETPLKVDALLPAIVENVVTINGRAYITTEQFAAISDVSERTLHRLFEDGKGPPKIKIAGVFYELDEVLKWATNQGRPIKRTAFVDNDGKA
jgi:hypothetical protein